MSVINGTEQNDQLKGTDQEDTIAGLGGSDHIDGVGGDDTLYGDYPPATFGSNPGNDTLSGGKGADTLYGQDGDDYLLGDAGDDFIDGGNNSNARPAGIGYIGDTAAYEGAKSGVVVSLLKQGASQNTHGAGHDTLVGIESLRGSQFADTLIGDFGDNALVGGAGDDRLYGGGGNDILYGGGGHDELHGGDGLDAVFFGDPSPGPALPAGTPSIDGVTLDLGAGTASYGADSATLSGIESATGSDFNDSLTGSKHGDTLDGAGGDDVIDGGGGNDELKGGAGADGISGSAGDDRLSGGDGDDTLNGGAGRDSAVFTSTSGQTGETADLAAGTASGNGSDTLISIENLIGGAGNDTLFGDGHDNVIDGGDGTDTIDGRGGDDTIHGARYMTGGAGHDSFVFLDTGHLGEILDLSDAKDIIDLSAIDADTTIAGDQAFTLTTTFPGYDAHGVALLYSPDGFTTFLYLYIDGDGTNHDEGAIIIDGDHTGFTDFIL